MGVTKEENNTYAKYAPNVWVARCETEKAKGDVIIVTTKSGKKHECKVYNCLGKTREGFHAYSVVRTDGYNHARARAEKYLEWADSREEKGQSAYEKSREHAEFLSLGEPIKVGHHSEAKHRRIIEQADNHMRHSVENAEKAEEHRCKAQYWADKANEINLSMPESLEYYTAKLAEAEETHKGLKSGAIPCEHAYSIAYAKKDVNNLKKKVELATKLWG